MKKQFLNIATFALLLAFTSCGSTKSNTTSSTTSNKVETTTERRGSKQRGGERPDAAQMFAQMDDNKDGKLSSSEVKGPLKENFSKIDTNNDNYISKEELENAPKPERRRGKR